MTKIVDLTGQKFHRLLVLGRSHKKSKSGAVWECLCDCGQTIHAYSLQLRIGRRKSCGCLKKDLKTSLKHGMRHTRTYKSWQSMKERCCNPKRDSYKNYGGKGILVCERWLNSFENFYSDMGERPKNTSLDRINNEGDYSPENCRWADIKTQAENRAQCITKPDFCATVMSMCSSMTKDAVARSLGVSRYTIYKACKKASLL